MLPKSPDNLPIGTGTNHANSMIAKHIQILTQMQRIFGGPDMRPFATILYCGNTCIFVFFFHISGQLV